MGVAIVGKSIAAAECQPVGDMNTTPLIDVMLVLLIMFIVTIPVMTHVIKLDLPHSPPAERQVPPEVLDLEIDFDGTVSWNGSVVPSLLLMALPTRIFLAMDARLAAHRVR